MRGVLYRYDKDGARTSWMGYTPEFPKGPLEEGEVFVAEDGCRYERIGERVRVTEPRRLLRKLEAARLSALADLEQDLAARMKRAGSR
jgi:hypothetical protein